MANFSEAEQSFIQHHLQKRSGERKAALERGHGFGNSLFLRNVWWPMFGHFADLHPEYEVYDFNRNKKYLDFAYITPHFKMAIEIDGYKTHVADLDRLGFRRELNRQAFLVGMGWIIYRCAYDDVNETPEVCKQLLQLIMGNYKVADGSVQNAILIEKELIRFACYLVRPIRPADVSQHFAVDHRTAIKWLSKGCERGWLRAVRSGAGQRVRYYELIESKIRHFW